MEGHHLVLGTLTDFLTGNTIQDTLDERLRQKIARWLVREKGYEKKDILTRQQILVSCGKNRAMVPLDFQITLHGKKAMAIKYGPGSILTRHRPALALSRLVAPYQVPVVVITNGHTADIISGDTGRLLAQGLASIPSCRELATLTSAAAFKPITAAQIERESRILYAYEIDDACPCDDTVCRL